MISFNFSKKNVHSHDGKKVNSENSDGLVDEKHRDGSEMRVNVINCKKIFEKTSASTTDECESRSKIREYCSKVCFHFTTHICISTMKTATSLSCVRQPIR